MKSKLEPHVDEIIKRYCTDKLSTYKIAGHYGVSHASISNLLKKHGIQMRKFKTCNKFNEFKEKYAEKVRSLKNAKKELIKLKKEIAEDLGISDVTVRWYVRRINSGANNEAQD